MPLLASQTHLQLTTRYNKPFEYIVKSFVLILHGRTRYSRIQLFLNRITNCRATSSSVRNLPAYLVAKFGEGAVGIIVGDQVFRNDEDLMRDGHVESGKSYYVAYEDYAPSYSDSLLTPPAYHDHWFA